MNDERRAYDIRCRKFGRATGYPKEYLDDGTILDVVTYAPHDAVTVIPAGEWTLHLCKKLAEVSPEAFGKLDKKPCNIENMYMFYNEIFMANNLVIAHIPIGYQTSGMWKTVMEIHPELYKYMPIHWKTQEHVYMLIKKNLLGSLYRFIPREHLHIHTTEYAVNEVPDNLKYAPLDHMHSDMIVDAVGKDPSLISDVPMQLRSLSVCYIALQSAANMGDLLCIEVKNHIPGDFLQKVNSMIV